MKVASSKLAARDAAVRQEEVGKGGTSEIEVLPGPVHGSVLVEMDTQDALGGEPDLVFLGRVDLQLRDRERERKTGAGGAVAAGGLVLLAAAGTAVRGRGPGRAQGRRRGC